ncbi:MAG: hypothetical protein Q4C53_06200 [Clostridia bacterium]|nr:hypothetical protein [Clostridia bacterium]
MLFSPYLLIAVAVIALLLWLLYANGYVAYTRKRALYYTGHSFRFRRFKACTGSETRVLPVRPGEVTVRFAATLSRGDCYCEIYSKDKSLFRTLYPNEDTTFVAERGVRYLIRYVFDHADGSFDVTLY